MHPIALLICLGILWAVLQWWLLPLVKERWKAGDLKRKMARAGVLVVVEKLRDFSAAGVFAVAAAALLVLSANLLSGSNVIWPQAIIAAIGEIYRVAKAFSDGYGIALGVLGLIAAMIVLWFAAQRARERVSEVWVQRAEAMFEALRTDPSILNTARRDNDLRTIVAQLDAAFETIQAQDGAAEPDARLLARAHAALNHALSQLAIEMARKQIDFPDAAGKPTAAEAHQPKSVMDRVLRVLSSKKLGEDLGLVRKPVGRIVTGLLFVSLVGWAAEPLANSLRPTVNNLRVQLVQAKAEQNLNQALSRADETVSEYEAPDEAGADAARLLARAFVREIARAPLLADAASAGERRAAEAEVVRAQMAEQRFSAEPNADPVTGARAEGVNSGPTPDTPSAGVRHAEEALEPKLREMQQRQPKRFATLLQQWEARYSAPISPLDAQGRLTARLLDEAFGAADLKPEGELAKQAQKLSKDFGKEAIKTWANGALKQFLADSLTGVARPEVQRAFAFEMSNDSRAFLEELRANEARGWPPRGTASGEAQMAARVAEKVAEFHPPPEREAMRERVRGYEFLFPLEDGHSPSNSGPAASPPRSTNFAAASRSSRVRGVLVGQTMMGNNLDVTDLRWQIVAPTRAGAATRVRLEMRIAASQRDIPTWKSIGSFDAGVLNQGLRYAADQRVVATTITPGDTKVMRRVTSLHPVLADTPLGCRVVEADRLVDAFTANAIFSGKPVDIDVFELARDRQHMALWLRLMRFAEKVAPLPDPICPSAEVRQAAEQLGIAPVRFSPRMRQTMEHFFNQQLTKPDKGADFLQRVQKCASVANAEIGKCLCAEVVPQGLSKHYWFPEDHTSQVREKKADLDKDLTWIKPTADRLGHLDFWTHTTFSLRNARNGSSDESQTAALDFPPEQLAGLRRLVAANLEPYVVGLLRSTSMEDFMGPLEEFVLAQRLARAALGGQLGPDFPLSRLIELQKQTRRFVPAQPTIRWEPMESEAELLQTLQQADPAAGNHFRAHRDDRRQRERRNEPMCAAASN
jgi:hypothetical protein